MFPGIEWTPENAKRIDDLQDEIFWHCACKAAAPDPARARKIAAAFFEALAESVLEGRAVNVKHFAKFNGKACEFEHGFSGESLDAIVERTRSTPPPESPCGSRRSASLSPS
jgi:hypothetical protein